MRISAKTKLIQLFVKTDKPLALHEIPGAYFFHFGEQIGYSENCIGTRMPELVKSGYVINGRKYTFETQKREGKNYNEWWLKDIRPDLPKKPDFAISGVKNEGGTTNLPQKGLRAKGLRTSDTVHPFKLNHTEDLKQIELF